MPERIFDLVVGFGQDQREIGLAQDRRAEHLAAARDAGPRHRHDVMLDDVKQAIDQCGGGRNAHPGWFYTALELVGNDTASGRIAGRSYFSLMLATRSSMTLSASSAFCSSAVSGVCGWKCAISTVSASPMRPSCRP